MRHRLIGLAVCLISSLLFASNVYGEQFKKAKYYPAGQRPHQVATAKLTESGNLDLIISDWLTNEIFISLGNGDGTFRKPTHFSNVGSPIAAAAADFNGDGLQDLAIVEYAGPSSGTLGIFLGQGDGKFRGGATYPIGATSASLAIADLNNDGLLDVIVTDGGNGGKGDVRVFFGKGDGTFRKPLVYSLAHGPQGVAAGDLNGDGFVDLAVTQAAFGTVAVFLNDGTGKFGKPTIHQAGKGGGEATDVKISDLRHNGKQDLIVANVSYGMVVLLNKGDGTFEKERPYLPCKKTCQAVEAVTVADFNLDGILDVATAASIGDGSLYYGKGDGTFKSAVPIHNSIGNFQDSGPSIASGDFNNDGAPDLAIPIQNDGKVAIMINTQ